MASLFVHRRTLRYYATTTSQAMQDLLRGEKRAGYREQQQFLTILAEVAHGAGQDLRIYTFHLSPLKDTVSAPTP